VLFQMIPREIQAVAKTITSTGKKSVDQTTPHNQKEQDESITVSARDVVTHFDAKAQGALPDPSRVWRRYLAGNGEEMEALCQGQRWEPRPRRPRGGGRAWDPHH
jgi:hypothetical protein